MRLIDADKLPATCTLTIVNGHIELTGWFAAERISEAPIVDAIPVEWIKTWLAKRDPYDDCIYDMLLDWEAKEHAID